MRAEPGCLDKSTGRGLLSRTFHEQAGPYESAPAGNRHPKAPAPSATRTGIFAILPSRRALPPFSLPFKACRGASALYDPSANTGGGVAEVRAHFVAACVGSRGSCDRKHRVRTGHFRVAAIPVDVSLCRR